MNKIIFNYQNHEISIQCNLDDQMKIIIQHFEQKLEVNHKDLLFYYNGNIINENLKLSQLINSIDKERGIMNVLVYNKDDNQKKPNFQFSKEIICPECGDNINLNIKNYKVFLSDCKNGHNFNDILFNDFLKTQLIDITKIKCDICKTNNKSESFD